MQPAGKVVDGFRFLPPSLAAWIRRCHIPEEGYKGDIPWTPMAKSLNRAVLALVTSAGISLKSDPPFDMEREKREALWGDRSFRRIPRASTARDININHLHINTSYTQQDINTMLPLERMAELESEGIIGRLADSHYSFYGFQWQNTEFIREAIAPMANQMKQENVDAVLLTPA
ncbi:MAG: glycine/sarcosine/betaine reductase selenoprotein B family protein [Hyphomicrobiales bacterium]